MAEILVVEDDEDVLALIEYRLVGGGHTVSTATDGESGLMLAQTGRPRLIVLDWMIPRLNGLEVCQAVRAEAELNSTRILMLTAKAQQNDLERAFAAGADDYLTKPFNPRELLIRVNALLNRR